MKRFPWYVAGQTRKPTGQPQLCLVGAILLCWLTILACSVSTAADPGLQQTEVAIGVQQTLLAQSSGQNAQQTIQAQQATLEALNLAATAAAGSQPTPDLSATQLAIAVQATMNAQPGIQPPTAAPPATEPPTSSQDFATWKQNATILVYEDIVNYPKLKHYVEDTLKGMGLRFQWTGSAKGTFKNALLAGPGNGKPWDLVILAVEARSEVSGEYFEYINGALNNGSSVIIEAWHLDEISGGTVSTILSRCGVGVYEYVGKTGTANDLIMWPTGISHPILSEPNSGMRFTNVQIQWSFDDLGDLMYLEGGGDAQILLGTKANDPTRNGGLAVCLGGQLILQTFSSHSYPFTVMRPLWENYITFALQNRFQRSP